MGTTSTAVLACIDGSPSLIPVCDYAMWAGQKTGLAIKLLHTVSTPQISGGDLSGSIGLGSRETLLSELAKVEQKHSKLQRDNGREILQQAEQYCTGRGTSSLSSLQRHGSLAETLLDLEPATELLVLGLRGEAHADNHKGIGRKIESVLRSIHRPTLIVNQSFSQPKNILLAYDGSNSAKKALHYICQSPLFSDTCCHAVFSGDHQEANEHLQHAKNQLEHASIAFKTALLDDRLDKSIVDYQEQHAIDLVVMGAFSHGKLRDLFLGSITTKVLKNSARPMLFLR